MSSIDFIGVVVCHGTQGHIKMLLQTIKPLEKLCIVTVFGGLLFVGMVVCMMPEISDNAYSYITV